LVHSWARPGNRLLSKLSKDKTGFVVYPTKLIEAVEKAMILQTKYFRTDKQTTGCAYVKKFEEL
jgi:hypothetical protein